MCWTEDGEGKEGRIEGGGEDGEDIGLGGGRCGMSSCGEGEVSYLLMLLPLFVVLLFWGGLPLSEVRVEALHKRGGGGGG